MRQLIAHTVLSAGLLPLLFAACSTTSAGASDSPAVADGASFRLTPGRSVALADRGTLRYVRVANDSRCPPNVQCVWAGDAEVEFEWTLAGAAPQSFTLHTGRGDRSKEMGGRRLTLESLARGAAPEATLRIEAVPATDAAKD